MSAIAETTNAPARRRRRLTTRRFPSAGPLPHLSLLLIGIVSFSPLYGSVVVASHDTSAIANSPPVVTPGPELFRNIGRVFNSGEVSISFWTALVNSAIVAGAIAFSVVAFSTLA